MQLSLLFAATTLQSCKSYHVHQRLSSIAFSSITTRILRSNSSSSSSSISSYRSNIIGSIDRNIIMSDNNFNKRIKLVDDSDSDSIKTSSKKKVIGTHSGSFQADEAMGCFLLRQLPEYRLSKIVRSRDPKVLELCDIVIDVGGIYDHETKRYDHHQKNYDERFEGTTTTTTTTDEGDGGDNEIRCTKLSASGLVYRHYGKDVIKAHYPDLSSEHLNLVYVKLYNSLLEALDAIDTGVEVSTTELVYRDGTGLSSRVGRLNPRWNEVDEKSGKSPNYDERFMEASALCGKDFLSVMTKIVESDLPAREIVEKAVLKRFDTDSSGEIICFPTGGLPWKGHLYELEKSHNVTPLIKFVLYTDQGGMWRVQAVTVEGKSFENRVSLPKEWRGVRDDDLEKVTHIQGSRFVHAAGFIGGNSYLEGALEMARVALVIQEDQ